MATFDLTDDEADAFDMVLDPGNWAKLHKEIADTALEESAMVVDLVIMDQEPLTKKVVGYRKYGGLSDDGSPVLFSEPSFLVLTTIKPDGDDVVEFTALPGFQAVSLPGAYVFGRLHGVMITEDENGDRQGLILQQGGDGFKIDLDSLTASAPVRPADFDRVTEFYNKHHGKGGLFTSGKGGGGGTASKGPAAGGTARSAVDSAKVKSFLKKAAIVAGVVAVVAGAVLLNQSVQNKNAATNAKDTADRKQKLNDLSNDLGKKFAAKRAADQAFHDKHTSKRPDADISSKKSSPAEKAASDKKLGLGRSESERTAEKAASDKQIGVGGSNRTRANTLGGDVHKSIRAEQNARLGQWAQTQESRLGKTRSKRQGEGYKDTLGG